MMTIKDFRHSPHAAIMFYEKARTQGLESVQKDIDQFLGKNLYLQQKAFEEFDGHNAIQAYYTNELLTYYETLINSLTFRPINKTLMNHVQFAFDSKLYQDLERPDLTYVFTRDYTVVCDETNNNATTHPTNIVVDVAIKMVNGNMFQPFNAIDWSARL